MKLENFLMNKLFNTFDRPIRFIYTNTGPLSRTINALMFWKLYKSDFVGLQKKFEYMNDFLQRQNISLQDKTVLELGPGNSYLNAYNFLLQGAKKVILVDKFPRYFNTKGQQEFFQKEIQFIKDTYNISKLPFITEEGQLNSEYIEFIPGEITDVEFKENVDFIYSISVLEHIKNVSDNIKAMNQVLNPGGLMYHHIDMRDHFNFSAPFLFYKYKRETWEKYLTKEGGSYTNRWRYTDFHDTFQTNNFEIVHEELQSFALDGYVISSDFANYTNLEVGILDILLKKQ